MLRGIARGLASHTGPGGLIGKGNTGGPIGNGGNGATLGCGTPYGGMYETAERLEPGKNSTRSAQRLNSGAFSTRDLSYPRRPHSPLMLDGSELS